MESPHWCCLEVISCWVLHKMCIDNPILCWLPPRLPMKSHASALLSTLEWQSLNRGSSKMQRRRFLIEWRSWKTDERKTRCLECDQNNKSAEQSLTWKHEVLWPSKWGLEWALLCICIAVKKFFPLTNFFWFSLFDWLKLFRLSNKWTDITRNNRPTQHSFQIIIPLTINIQTSLTLRKDSCSTTASLVRTSPTEPPSSP